MQEAFCQNSVFSNDENNHNAIIKRESHANYDTDTYENISFLPTRSNVVVQCEDQCNASHIQG